MYTRKTVGMVMAMVLWTSAQSYGGYRFTPIAETVDDIGPIPTMGDELDWVLNNAGQVLFSGRSEIPAEPALYRGDGGMLTVIAPSWLYTPNYAGGATSFDMNDAGTVVFTSRINWQTWQPQNAYTTQDGVSFNLVLSRETYLSRPDTWPLGYSAEAIGAVSINNAGVIAFEALADLTGDHMAYDPGLYLRQPDGSIDTIFSAESMAFDVVGPLSINNANAVTFRGSLDEGASSRLFQSSAPGMFKIIDGQYHDYVGGGPVPSVNDSGTAIFAELNWDGPPSDDDSKLILSDGNTRTTAVAMHTMDGFQNPAVNNAGQVAYGLWYWDEVTLVELEGIFAGPDLVADKVITQGDTLFGMSVQDIAVSTRGLNDQGQIAFWASLYDSGSGTYVYGLYLADPICLGDFNLDGETNLLDIAGFTEAIVDGGASFLAAHPGTSLADIDPSGGASMGDPAITLLDIPFFVNLVTGAGEAAGVPEPAGVAVLVAGWFALLRRR